MNVFLKRAITFFMFVAITSVLFFIINFPMWPRSIIRESLLSKIPLESSIDKVLTYAESKEWKVMDKSLTHGFVDQRQNTYPDEYACNTGVGKLVERIGYNECVVGDKYLRTYLGNYRLIFVTSVTVFWAFDKDGKLIDVWVWKDEDSL